MPRSWRPVSTALLIEQIARHYPPEMGALSLKITRSELARTLALLRVARGWSQQEVAEPPASPPRSLDRREPPGVGRSSAFSASAAVSSGAPAPKPKAGRHARLSASMC